MPSFTRSGAPRSIFVRSSASEMTSTAFAVSRLQLAVDVHGGTVTNVPVEPARRPDPDASRRQPNLALRPPSTVITAPLTNDEAGSARLSTMCATSSGSP